MTATELAALIDTKGDTLEAVLQDAALIADLYAHCKKEYNANELEFIAAYDMWKGSAKAGVKAAFPKLPGGNADAVADWLWDEFVKTGGDRELNITGRVRAEVQSAIAQARLTGQAGPACFAKVRDAAANTMNDPLSRWKTSVNTRAEEEKEAAREAKLTAAVVKLRQHQKGKIDGFKLIGGKHPSGAFVLYPTCVDGSPILLVSSAQGKAVDAKYIQLAEAVGGDSPIRGIWVQQGTGASRTFTVEGTAAVDPFTKALAKMNVRAKVAAGTKAEVNKLIAVVDPKKSEEALRSKQIDAELKKEQKQTKKVGLTFSGVILGGNADKGYADADEAWKAGSALVNRYLDRKVAEVAKKAYATSTEGRKKLAQAVKAGNYWVVLYGDLKQMGQHRDAFVGLFLYRGASKPNVAQNPLKLAVSAGWLCIANTATVTAAYVSEAMGV